jgi:hypothetical protein
VDKSNSSDKGSIAAGILESKAAQTAIPCCGHRVLGKVAVTMRSRGEILSARSVIRVLLVVTAALIGVVAVRNFVLLSQDLLLGNGGSSRTFPAPALHPEYLGESEPAVRLGAVGKPGLDFAQVAFNTLDLRNLENAYVAAKTPLPDHRESRYAPAVVLLCAVTICRLPYGLATYLHVTLQLAIFAVALFTACKAWGLSRLYWPSLGLSFAYIMITPGGLSWFERGQFTLFVATSYLFLLLGLSEKRNLFIALASALAFIKWTSLPFCSVVLAMQIMASRSRVVLQERVVQAAVFAGVFAGLLLIPAIFFPGTDLFLRGLARQELLMSPAGGSLAQFFPRVVVKLLPLAMGGIGIAILRLRHLEVQDAVPYLIATAALLLLYPTLAFDYTLPCLLGLLPSALRWLKQRPPQDYFSAASLYACVAFLLVVSYRTDWVSQRTYGVPRGVALHATWATAWLYVIVWVVVALFSILLPHPTRASGGASLASR